MSLTAGRGGLCLPPAMHRLRSGLLQGTTSRGRRRNSGHLFLRRLHLTTSALEEATFMLPVAKWSRRYGIRLINIRYRNNGTAGMTVLATRRQCSLLYIEDNHVLWAKLLPCKNTRRSKTSCRAAGECLRIVSILIKSNGWRKK